MADGSPMTFAGLWDINRSLNIESFTIVTTAANATLRPLHDRLPVILRPEDFDRRLDAAQPDEDLLVPAPDEAVRHFPVDRRVGSHKHDDAALIEPVAIQA